MRRFPEQIAIGNGVLYCLADDNTIWAMPLDDDLENPTRLTWSQLPNLPDTKETDPKILSMPITGTKQ